MADGFDWLDLLPELVNIVIATTFLVLFLVRMRRLTPLAEGSRFNHINPYGRARFVFVFILAAIAQLGYIVYNLFADRSLDNEINVSYMIGTWINSFVLVVEVFLMRKEIKKEQPYSPLHRLYWIYLPLITCFRLVEQVVKEERLVDLAISFVLFVDALVLCVYSLFCKRQEIAEFQNYALFQFDQLEESLRTHHILFKLGSMERSQDDFQRLSIDVSLVDRTHFQLKVYHRKQEISRRVVSLDDVERFHASAAVLEVKNNRLQFSQEIEVKDVKAYFDELLANWLNYEQFVLEFLAVPKHIQEEIIEEIGEMSGQQELQSTEFIDPSANFFNVSVWKVVRVSDHYEFFLSISSHDRRYRKQINKRFNQFEELDRRLRNTEVKVHNNNQQPQLLKLRPPELPDKFYLVMDEEAIDERMQGLEHYSRRLLNDRLFVKQYEEVSGTVLGFFGFEDISNTILERSVNLAGMSCVKSNISTRISGKGETSLYYGFQVKQHGRSSYEIGKRYSEFVEFNKELRRWLLNHQHHLEHRSIVLPPKAISLNERQKLERHTDLAVYLNAVMSQIPGISSFYEFRVFMQRERPDSVSGSKEVSVARTNSQGERLPASNIAVDLGSEEMSQLIDQLGEDANRLVI